MRRVLLAAVMSAVAICVTAAMSPAQAQTEAHPSYRAPDIAAQHAAMQRLAPLIGNWRGEAEVMRPHQMTVHQSEQVESALDGLALIIRGIGHANAERAGAPVFQAIGLITYDDAHGIYRMHTYAMGRAGDATAQFQPDGSFRWSLEPGGPMRMRYTIWFEGDTWREVGEMSHDAGATWTQTIELDLRRAE